MAPPTLRWKRSLSQIACRTITRLPISALQQFRFIERWSKVEEEVTTSLDRVIHVRTDNIQYFCLFKFPFHRFVLRGDWDEKAEPLVPGLLKKPHFSCVYEILVEGRNYEETAQYQTMIRELDESGRTERGISTVEEVHEYFESLLNAVSDIRENGYRSQKELGGPPHDEIRVVVDRKGRLLKYFHGHHRLAIARILEIPVIPVFIQCVHYDWVAETLRSSRKGLPATLHHAVRTLAEPSLGFGADRDSEGTG